MKKYLNILILIFVYGVIMSSCQSKKEEAITKNSEKVDGIFSTDVFNIKVPKEFDGLYDVEVDDHTINFFDKESKKADNPGFIFGIQVFENANDWAGGPVEKFGELKLNSGKLYDVVLSYPTESQFGFSSDGTAIQMPANYKYIYDARYKIASFVSGNDGEIISVGAGMKGKDLYYDVLNKHLIALNEKWDSNKLEEEQMSPMYVNMVESDKNILEKVGYAYRDINQDGIDELLIGEIADGNLKDVIYDIYTIVNRKPAHVLSGWSRNRYFDFDDSFIVNEYSNGANESGLTVWTLNSNSTELTLQFAVKYDGYTDEKNPWFIFYNKNEEEFVWESITEKEYNERCEKFYNHVDLGYKAFSTIKGTSKK